MPLTEEQTLKRLRDHKEGQACPGSTQPDDENQKSGSESSSDESSEVSAADSLLSGSAARKKKPKLTTPRKPTSGLQQLGSASSTKEKQVASSITVEVIQKMQASTRDIEEALKKYVSGMYDAARGRLLQGVQREWVDLIAEAKKQLKVDGTSDEKRALQSVLQQLEATSALVKVVVKPAAPYLETAACYDTLMRAGGEASEGCRKTVLERHVDEKLSSGQVYAVITLMSKQDGAHGVYELMTEALVPWGLAMVATKLVQAVFKVKLVGSLEVAQNECADLTFRFKHALGYPDFPEDLRTQLDTMFTAMHLAADADVSCICQAAEFVRRFPPHDMRKLPETPFAAFSISKVGKTAIKNLVSQADAAAKELSKSKDFKGVDARVLALKESSTTLDIQLLQVELMPHVRQLKACCKGANPAEVECVVHRAMTMFRTV